MPLLEYIWWVRTNYDVDNQLSNGATCFMPMRIDGPAGAPGWIEDKDADYRDSWSFIAGPDGLYWIETELVGPAHYSDLRVTVKRARPAISVYGAGNLVEVVAEHLVEGPGADGYQVGLESWYANLYWDAGLVVRATHHREVNYGQYGWVESIQTDVIRSFGVSKAHYLHDLRADELKSQGKHPVYEERGARVSFADGAAAYCEVSAYTPV